MSGNTWVYADPHFGQQSICRFLNDDGSKLRPWQNANTMTEDLIRLYNEVVDDQDRVYILGDVSTTRKGLNQALPRLKGRKVLIKGNHDTDKLSYYAQYFEDIRACKVGEGFILTHIPVHPLSLARWGFNIHGHLHSRKVSLTKESYYLSGGGREMIKFEEVPDSRYRCVSVEQTSFKPILLSKILEERK